MRCAGGVLVRPDYRRREALRDFACGGRAPLDQGCIGLNSCLGTNIETGGHFLVIGVESHEISFQCPKCGHDLKRTIGRLKANEHMTCPGCGIGINIDTDRLARATEEIQNALDKIPPEITIKFFR